MGLKWKDRQRFRQIGKGDLVRVDCMVLDGIWIVAMPGDTARIVEDEGISLVLTQAEGESRTFRVRKEYCTILPVAQVA